MRSPDGRFTTLGRGVHITSSDFAGIALWYLGECETHYECAEVRMVGDDQTHHANIGTIEPLDRDDFCGGCGQIGCGHG
jgi:hypothetical protein